MAILLLLNAIAFAQTSSDPKSVTINLNNASLIEVLKAIETQSGVSFVYNTTVMKNAQKVCIDVKDIDLSILLQTICSKSGNNYKIINHQVVFYKVTASTTKSIKISTKPETDDSLKVQNTPDPITENVSASVKNVPPKQVIDSTNTISIKDTSIQQLCKASSIQNIELTQPVLPEVTSLLYTVDNSIPNNEFEKKAANKLFLSFQATGFMGINPGFKSNSSLDSETTQILNKSVSSYGHRECLYLGYALKHFSFKTGLGYSQLNEELTEEHTYNQFSKDINSQVITWQEQNSDGILIHTDTVPVSQTTVTDSTVITNIKYTYTYIEIPFYIDYTFKLNSKWSVFSSLGCTYAIYLKNNNSETSDYYQPESVNKLDLSIDLNLGLKFDTKHLQYYLMAGGMMRSSYAPKNNLIQRNPAYTSISIGVINYF